MKLLIRCFFLVVSLFTIYYLLFTNSVHAEGEIETDYQVQYSVQESGLTNIIQKITLKNKTPNYYADKFELKLGTTRVENIRASDATGPLETNVSFDNNITTINVKFKQKVIGLDKSLPWTISYSSTEIASRAGQIWEIAIPKLAKSQDIGRYEATVSIPISFGPIAFAVPQSESFSKKGLTQDFNFSKEQLTASGISMSFGQKQIFQMDLSYFLENNNLTTQVLDIALPPDNNYQKVVYEKIDPQPLDVVVDRDGNFIAKYKLPPKSEQEIKVKGQVEVTSNPFRNINKKLTEQERETYTQPQKYWETDNILVQEKARDLKTPKEIYDFVSEFLTYSNERVQKAVQENRIQRFGAAQSITDPKSAVCMEFTDLFVALARSKGIPARAVEGYAYTQNERLRPLSLALPSGDILHAWPEYWDETLGWVQVDPTWGSTSGGLDYFNKLDFNHITFVHKGVSSTYPYPVGSYKKMENQNKKDVLITFTQEPITPTTSPQIALDIPDKIISGVPVRIHAQVKNVGTSSILSGMLSIKSSKLQYGKGKESPLPTKDGSIRQEVSLLPPFSSRDYEFRLQTKNLFEAGSDTIVLTFNEDQISKSIEIVPLYKIVFTTGFLASLVIAIIITVAGLILYERMHRQKLAIPRPRNSNS